MGKRTKPRRAPTPAHPSSPDPNRSLTLIDLSAFLAADARNLPDLSPATLYTYRTGCRQIFNPDTVDPTTPIDQLDLEKLAAACAAANPELKPATIRTYATSAHAAITALRNHHTPPLIAPGTIARLPAFLADARDRGTMRRRTAGNNLSAIGRLLHDLPDLAAQELTTLDFDRITQRFAALNPTLKDATIRAYISRLHQTITAYTASPSSAPAPSLPAHHGAPAPAGAAHPAAASTATADHLAIPLPGGREVSLRTPPDLTAEECAATGALLRLYHPHLFTPAPHAHHPAPADPQAWTLVFWPEDAPDEPQSAHLSGGTFRRALAEYIRTRRPQLADTEDGEAIDAWFSTEVFVALALDGHHTARDAGTLL